MALHWQIVLALVLGALVGVLINQFWTAETWRAMGVEDARAFLEHRTPTAPAEGAAGPSNDDAGGLAYAARFIAQGTDFVGDLFIRCLRFIAVPIVLFSLIVGVASLGDLRALGRIGGKSLGLFVITTVMAAGLGLLLSNVVKPGTLVPQEKREELAAARAQEAQTRIAAGEKVAAETSVWQEIVDIIPANPFAALANAEMLQVVFLAAALGAGLTLVAREKREVAIRVCDAFQDAIIVLVGLVMKCAPFAVFALLATTVSGLGLDVLGALATYCLVVLLGLGLVLVVVYPGMTWLLTPRGNRVGLVRFFRAMSPAQLLAFSSSSSSATLPVTMQCTRDRLGVSDEITSFVCPLGATTNMGGTALYQGVAVTFLAQLFGIELSVMDQVTVVALATLIAIGSPGVPGGSIVMMVIVLEAVGVPPTGIAVILAVDRILDMARTVVNISGDAAVAAVVAASEKALLPDPMAKTRG
jgi:Na+/H+-dicarboxylate symporter